MGLLHRTAALLRGSGPWVTFRMLLRCRGQYDPTNLRTYD